VRFLREVASSSYKVVTGITTATFPSLNILALEDELSLVQDLRPSDYQASTGVLNIYHESTHAWLDLQAERSDVRNLRQAGVAYYRGAALEKGGATNDPARIFQEAIAEYVGHRAAAYWTALATLSAVAGAARRKGLRRDVLSSLLRKAVRTRDTYERDMAQRTFGYQTACFWCAQQYTTKVISTPLKGFADRVLLEDKLSEHFARSGQPFMIWSELQREFSPMLGNP
jgi:hypothetical protein